MNEPKTARQFNSPLTGETQKFTIKSEPDPLGRTIASGAIVQVVLAGEMEKRRKLDAALSTLIQDPLIRQ